MRAFVFVSALVLGACGGGGSDVAAPVVAPLLAPQVATVVTLSGVAATGGSIAGRIFLKDSAGHEQSLDTPDGRYSFVVTGLVPPLMLKAAWTTNGATSTLYSFAASGEGLVAWSEIVAGHSLVRARFLRAGASAPVALSVSGDAGLPKVALDAAGNAIVVWTLGAVPAGFNYPVPKVAANAAGRTIALWGLDSYWSSEPDESHPGEPSTLPRLRLRTATSWHKSGSAGVNFAQRFAPEQTVAACKAPQRSKPPYDRTEP